MEEEDTKAVSSHEVHVFGARGKIGKRHSIGVCGKILGLFSDAKDRAVLLKVMDISYVRWAAVHRGGISTEKTTRGPVHPRVNLEDDI